MSSPITTPRWVTEEPFIQHILHSLLDKVERGVRPYIRVNEKTTPPLYNFNGEDTEYLWGLVTLLDNEHHLLSIKKPKKRSPVAHYDQNQLYLMENKIPLLREWLGRPALDAYSMVWQTMVKEYGKKLFDSHKVDLSPLGDTPIRFANKSAEQVVKGFCKIPDVLTQPKSLRTLSAQCFWGDSKFLDYRGTLIRTLFPNHAQWLQVRPLLINAFIPPSFNQIIFVENQESFLSLVNAVKSVSYPIALIYSAGFRGSAMRIREKDAVVWSHVNSVDSHSKTQFELWWTADTLDDFPVFFWGDFDYAAMKILAALRKSFTHLEAWPPGYEAMLPYHKRGLSHRLVEAGKENQRPPQSTGCTYADTILLPLMRDSELFVDQEIVDIADVLLRINSLGTGKTSE